MESKSQDESYISSVISSVITSFADSANDQEILRKLEHKWMEKLKIIDEKTEKTRGKDIVDVTRYKIHDQTKTFAGSEKKVNSEVKTDKEAEKATGTD